MSVNISLFAGAGWQFFDNNGVPLAGGLLYTYAAGTTTPQTTYTTSAGNIANSNPIVLDSAGRTPNEIWLTTGLSYKFLLKTSVSTQIGSYDNIFGANDFTAVYAALAASSGSSLVGFIQSGTGAVAETVQTKLRETVSVKDFGAVGDGTTDDTASIQAAINFCQASGRSLFFPAPTVSQYYKVTSELTITGSMNFIGEGMENTAILGSGLGVGKHVIKVTDVDKIFGCEFRNFTIIGDNACNGMLINNLSGSTLQNIGVRNVLNGFNFTGSAANNYQLTCDNLSAVTAITGSTVNIAAGGILVNSTFIGCFFSGLYGFTVQPTASFNSCSFISCNFEGATNEGFYCGGSMSGTSFVNSRTEGNLSLVADFLFKPDSTGAGVNGITITGGFFNRGNAASAIRFDVATGAGCRGFLVSGNFCRQGYTQLVYLNGTGDNGTITGNYQESGTAYPAAGLTVNGSRPTVFCANNTYYNTATTTYTDSDSLSSNSGVLTAAGFSTSTGTAAATGSGVTIFTVPAEAGSWIISAWTSGSASVLIGTVIQSGAGGSTPYLVNYATGGGGTTMALSTSNVQLTAASGTMHYCITRVASNY